MKLSSRLLLVILKKLPDTSEFKTQALRGGDWTVFQKMAAETHREIALLRASYLSGHGVEGDDAKYYPFESPLALVKRIEEQDAEEEDASPDLIASLFGN